MALRINHTSGGPVHWLQGLAYTAIFSGVTALTLDFSFKLNAHVGTGNVWLLSMINQTFFFSLDTVINAGVSSASPLAGVGGALNDGLWHRIQLALTTNGGNLNLLVDGNLVDQRVFAAATTEVDVNGLLWVGIKQQNDGWTDTLDYSIDQINGCVGLAMTETQLGNIARGANVFSDYATVVGNRFRFDFTQTAPGSPANVGSFDAGLADLDGTLPPLVVGHGTPLWDSDHYVYTNPCNLLTPIVQCSGSTIEFPATDATGNPMLLTWQSGQTPSTPSVTLNGGSAVYLSHDGSSTGRPLYLIDGENTLIPNWRLPFKAAPTDVIGVTIPAGVFKGSNGAPNVATPFTAVNNRNVLRSGFNGTVATNHPRIGVVGSGQEYYVTEYYYSNLLMNSDGWIEYGGTGSARFTFDSVGNITGITGSSGSGNPFIRIGWNNEGLKGGTYTLLYKGGTPFICGRGGSSEGGTGITVLDSGTLGSMHRKRYTIVRGTEIEVHATIPTDSIQLLDSDCVDVTGYASVGMIHPVWQGFYAHPRCDGFRHLTAVNNDTGGMSYVAPDGWFSPWNGVIVSSPLATFTQVFGGSIPAAFTGVSFSCFHVATSAPHGFTDGQLLCFQGTGGWMFEEQHFSLAGSPAGGTFTISAVTTGGTVTTGAIAWNADAPTIQAAMVAAFGASTVKVSGATGPGTDQTVRFYGAATHGIALLTIDVSGLTGGTPAYTHSRTITGGGLDGTPDIRIVVDDATHFYVNWPFPAAPGTASPTYKATVVHQYSPDLTDPLAVVSGMGPLDRVIQLCNDCNITYYFTYPALWSDAEIAAHEVYVKARLKPGLKNIREYANEAWNIGSTVFAYCHTQGLQLGLGGTNPGARFYGQRSAQAILAGRNAWVGAGGAPGDFIGIMCWQAVDALTAYNECYTYGKAWWTGAGHSGEPWDLIGYAPYSGFDLTPDTINGNQRYADYFLAGGAIDPEALHDVLEQDIGGKYTEGAMKAYCDLFHPIGYKFGFYEWGTDFALNGQTVESGMPSHNYAGGDAQIIAALIAMQQHPRMNNINIATMNRAATYNCTDAYYLGSVGTPTGQFGTEVQRWTMWQPDGDGTANIGHLTDVPPPVANNAFSLAQIALTAPPEPTSGGSASQSIGPRWAGIGG